MLTFAHPRLLLLVLAVPPLVWWWLRRKRGSLRYPATGLIDHLPTGRSPRTLSHSVLLRMLDEEEPRTITGEMETNISDALVLGLHRLQSAGPRRKVLVLLSDGEHNVPHPQSAWTPRQASQIAANLGIPVYAIDAGGEGGSGKEVTAREEAAPDTAARRSEGIRTLQEVARITRGRYFA